MSPNTYILNLMLDDRLEEHNMLKVSECVICLEDIDPNNNYAKPANEDDWDVKYHIECLSKWFTYSNKGVTSDQAEDSYILYNKLEPYKLVPIADYNSQIRVEKADIPDMAYPMLSPDILRDLANDRLIYEDNECCTCIDNLSKEAKTALLALLCVSLIGGPGLFIFLL